MLFFGVHNTPVIKGNYTCSVFSAIHISLENFCQLIAATHPLSRAISWQQFSNDIWIAGNTLHVTLLSADEIETQIPYPFSSKTLSEKVKLSNYKPEQAHRFPGG
jgi:hypothetical protein